MFLTPPIPSKSLPASRTTCRRLAAARQLGHSRPRARLEAQQLPGHLDHAPIRVTRSTGGLQSETGRRVAFTAYERHCRWSPNRGTKPPEFKAPDRKSTRLNSSHANISYAVFCL